VNFSFTAPKHDVFLPLLASKRHGHVGVPLLPELRCHFPLSSGGLALKAGTSSHRGQPSRAQRSRLIDSSVARANRANFAAPTPAALAAAAANRPPAALAAVKKACLTYEGHRRRR